MSYEKEFFFRNHSENENQEKIENDLNEIYYHPKTGFCGINELVRKSGYSPKIVKEFLDSQDTYTKHKPAKYNYPRNRVIVNGIDDQFQADLVEMIPYEKENKHYRYLLTCIDVFSKYAWVIPIKNKKAEDVVNAFTIIFKKRIPKHLQTDLGKEFYNSSVKKYLTLNNVNHFSSNSPLKASVVERFNRTLKEKMWKYFSEVNNKNWIDVIDELVSNYNNSFHRSIKMTPIEASKKENEKIVRGNLYPEVEYKKETKFIIGDKVRINRYKTIFDKGYQQTYTTEIFEICEIRKTNPVTYRIKDYNNEVIEGIFYEQELVKYNKKDDLYQIEKIIKTKKVKGKTKYFVKWKDYPESMNSWVDAII